MFSYATGGARRLSNGNTLIDFGVDGPQAGLGVLRLVEVDSGGTCVAEVELSAPGKRFQYRAKPLDSLFGETPVD